MVTTILLSVSIIIIFDFFVFLLIYSASNSIVATVYIKIPFSGVCFVSNFIQSFDLLIFFW